MPESTGCSCLYKLRHVSSAPVVILVNQWPDCSTPNRQNDQKCRPALRLPAIGPTLAKIRDSIQCTTRCIVGTVACILHLSEPSAHDGAMRISDQRLTPLVLTHGSAYDVLCGSLLILQASVPVLNQGISRTNRLGCHHEVHRTSYPDGPYMSVNGLLIPERLYLFIIKEKKISRVFIYI